MVLTTTLSAQKCRSENLVFSDTSFIAIFAEATKDKCVMHRRSHELLASLLKAGMCVVCVCGW